MHRLLRVLPAALALAALGAVALLATNCGSGNQAQVRFVQAIPDASSLDIDFNGIKEFTGIGFFQVQPNTGYTAVPAGSVTVEGFASGSTVEAFTVSNVSLNAGTEYTMVATGNITSSSSVVLVSPNDNNTAPTNGQVSFRVIDASLTGPASIAVYILPNDSSGMGPGVTQTTPITMTVSSPLESTTADTSAYVNQSFNSLNTGFTMYVCVSGNFNPMFSASIANLGSATEGAIRTIVLTDNSSLNGMNTQPIVMNDLN